MFELPTKTTVYLDKVNTRIEHHGDAHVMAIDLKCTMQCNNRVLDMLDENLRPMLFCARVSGKDDDGQTKLELPVSELPNIACTRIEYPIKLDHEFAGHTTRVDYGRGGKADIVLNLCVLKNFKITPVEGGSVELEFTISSAADIDEAIIGKLSLRQQSDIQIVLTAPAVEVVQDVPEAPKKGKAKKEPGPTATDIFANSKPPPDLQAPLQ